MTNIVNLPSFIYPKYSDIYFKQKKEIEEDAAAKLKQLSAFQPFYEKQITVLNKFSFDRPVKLRTGINWIVVDIYLMQDDKLSMLRPLIEALILNFNQAEYTTEPFFRTWEPEAYWYFADRDEKHLTRHSITINAKYGEAGLADLKVKKVPRVTTTTDYTYFPLDTWWKKN